MDKMCIEGPERGPIDIFRLGLFSGICKSVGSEIYVFRTWYHCVCVLQPVAIFVSASNVVTA